MTLYSCLLCCEVGFVTLDILVEACDIFCCRGNLDSCVAREDYCLKIIWESQPSLVLYEIGGEESYSPCATLTCCLHYGDRGVERCCENTLPDAWSLEQSAMACDAVHLYMLIVEEDVVAELEDSNCG